MLLYTYLFSHLKNKNKCKITMFLKIISYGICGKNNKMCDYI